MNKLITFLRYKFLILHRKLKSLGLEYWLFYPILLFIFFILYKKLPTFNYQNQEYGDYILAITSLNTFFNLRIKKEESQWISIFDNSLFYKFSINLIVGIPFLILAIFLNYKISIFLTILTIIVLSFYQFRISLSLLEKINLSFLMPDFEFIEGFRKLWFIHLIGIILFAIGLQVENHNLAIFGYFLFLNIIVFYYQNPEHQYLIWILGLDSDDFIFKKSISISKKIILLSIPFIILYLIYTKDFFIFYVFPISILGILNSMLCKYLNSDNFIISFYQSFAILFTILCLVNPIYILVNLGFFYFLRKKAITELNTFLK